MNLDDTLPCAVRIILAQGRSPLHRPRQLARVILVTWGHGRSSTVAAPTDFDVIPGNQEVSVAPIPGSGGRAAVDGLRVPPHTQREQTK